LIRRLPRKEYLKKEKKEKKIEEKKYIGGAVGIRLHLDDYCVVRKLAWLLWGKFQFC
jgi:hypothetical protein